MFNEKMKALQEKIASLTASINDDKATIMASLEADKLDDAQTLQANRDKNKELLAQAKSELALFESALEGNLEGANASGGFKPVVSKGKDHRAAVNSFIRSKGADTNGVNLVGKDEIEVPYSMFAAIVPTTDGVKKENTKPITSDEISYNPEREINTVTDLKKFTRIHNATKGKGSYPILKQATTKMISVAELEKNPALAKPEFTDVSWEVMTYRGAIPLSQESIDDADVDLVSIVNENIGEIKLNTTNAAISAIFKTFAAKEVSDLDGLKAIQNVDLDPAYNISYVVSQSFYQFLDTIKDGNGRYLLQDSIISPTGKVFSGHPIHVISDDVWGVGESHAFVGDIKRAVLFADRKNLGLRWADNEVYGQYLQAVTRFDVKVADAQAGYFVTYKAATKAATK